MEDWLSWSDRKKQLLQRTKEETEPELAIYIYITLHIGFTNAVGYFLRKGSERSKLAPRAEDAENDWSFLFFYFVTECIVYMFRAMTL